MKPFDNRIAYSCLAEQNMNCHGVPLTKATSKSYKLCKPYPRLHPVADFIFFLTNNCMLGDYQNPSSGKPTNQDYTSKQFYLFDRLQIFIFSASLISSSLKSGCAIEIIASAFCQEESPFTFTIPYSVTR